jgi:hypothetical protein
MSLQDQPIPETLSAFEAAYRAAFNDIRRLYARMSPTEEATKELEITLSQVLAALITEGVTDPRELRRRAFEAVACTVLMP